MALSLSYTTSSGRPGICRKNWPQALASSDGAATNAHSRPRLAPAG
jgi:hypothetical protein